MAGQNAAKVLTHEPQLHAPGFAQPAIPSPPSLPQRGKQMPGPHQVGVESVHLPSWPDALQESAQEPS